MARTSFIRAVSVTASLTGLILAMGAPVKWGLPPLLPWI